MSEREREKGICGKGEMKVEFRTGKVVHVKNLKASTTDQIIEFNFELN